MSGLGKFFLGVFLLFSCIILKSYGQESFRVAFYNVENLYDTINNPRTFDDDLTPDGNLRWGSYRYSKKIEDISKAISSLGGEFSPALIGLCEVENDSVIRDLTLRSSLARHKYKYVITKSKDSRGSNIALLYQRDQMKLIQRRSYTPIIDKENNQKTRDILHVVGRVVSGDTLDIFVCHYPSRSGGVAKSRPFRIAVSKLLRKKIDEVYKARGKANIIIMGDFNDYPYDTSMKDVLEAKSLTAKIEDGNLYNMFLHHGRKKKTIASYKYQGKWDYLDQIIVSGALLNEKNTTYIINSEAYVYSPDFLLDYDERYGGVKPFRTFSGWKYLGGTSDHLPIYMDLYVEE